MRRNWLRIAQWAFATLVVVFTVIALSSRWELVRGRLVTLDISWGYLVAASVLVLGAYAVLIETWARVLASWDVRLGWGTAMRIWFASSLGKYIPGNVWALAAMGVMAKERGASGVAAAGSSILVNVLNLVSGLAVVLLFGAGLIQHAAVFEVACVLLVLGAGAAPWIMPPLVRLVCRVTGRDVPIPDIPPITIWLSLVGTGLAWCAYGIAFRFFCVAMLGNAAVHGGYTLYVAAYTAAYIVGFITLFAPAGLGVREAGLIEGLSALGLTSHNDAVIVAVTSRLWLTVLEVLPGLIALAAGQTRPRTRTL